MLGWLRRILLGSRRRHGDLRIEDAPLRSTEIALCVEPATPTFPTADPSNNRLPPASPGSLPVRSPVASTPSATSPEPLPYGIAVPPEGKQVANSATVQVPAPPAPRRRLPFLDALGGPVTFFDVETTGLSGRDRIVSIGVIQLDPAHSDASSLHLVATHLIFDPGIRCHPAAAAVHGHSDWTLRHQPFFADHAPELHAIFDRSSLIVAHNVQFDLGFLAREFEAAGLAIPDRRTACTMRDWVERYGRPAGLGAAIARIGLARQGRLHGAMEDAWLAMQVWLHLNGSATLEPPADAMMAFRNLRPVPPEPPEPWPKRRRRPARMKASRQP